MKQLALCVLMALALCVINALAQNADLVGTTWVLKYTTGKANSTRYEEYARITFLKGGKAEVRAGNSPETAKWSLKGNKLVINNSDDGALVHYVEVTINGPTATGTGELGMTTTVPYWVRLIKQENQRVAPRGTEGSQDWNSFWEAFRTAAQKRDRVAIRSMMSPSFEYGVETENRDNALKYMSEANGGWADLNKVLARGIVPFRRNGRRAYVAPPNGDGRTYKGWSAVFELGDDGRWRWIAFRFPD